MKSLDILVSSAHHLVIYKSQPERMCHSEGSSYDNHNHIPGCIAEDCREGKGEKNRYEEHHKLYDELKRVLEVSLGCYFLVQWQRLFIEYRQ